MAASSPVSSLTRLLQKQNEDKKHSKLNIDSSHRADDDNELTNAVSIEGVEVQTYGDDQTPTPEDLSHQSSYNQRSPISINPSSYSRAPPIRAPLQASIHRQPSQSNGFNFNNSYSNGHSYSSSIPFSVPNSGNQDTSNNNNNMNPSSVPRLNGLPSNISMIESINITSPKVSTSDIEPRFVISKQKVAAAHAANSQSRSSSTSQSSGMFSRSRKNSQMDLGSFYNNNYFSQNSPANGNPPPIDIVTGSPSSSSSIESYSKSRHSSMVDLKRFFKKSGSSSKTNGYPASSFTMSPIASNFSMGSSLSRDRSGSMSSSYNNNVTQYTTPQTLPFSKRYGKFGENLGAGAGGSVKLVKRLSDQKVFAVKEFRQRTPTETRREYAKKITGEYCIGSTLRHANIIETVEIAYENDRILQVMEYCDYDLFAIVMSNKMSDHEINCCFKQILTGIEYLHHMGLAHRDLKLDNCVINSQGIVKLIDFGSAVVFSYPFSKTLIESSGIVGSDPYLSPETLVFSKYDPRPVDIWSAAMIYCCMVLKKFPWKVPKLADNSFKLFCSGRDCDSLSALLTRVPSPKPFEAKPVEKPSGLSNLSKALSKPLEEVETAKPGNTETTETTESTETISSHESSKNSTPLSIEGTTPPQPTAGTTPTTPAPSYEETTGKKPDQGDAHTSQLVGDARLLQALPAQVRNVIGRMVDLAPACRASIDEVMSDPWLKSVQMCTVEEHLDSSGISKHVYHKAENHQHTEVDQSEAHIASLEKKKNRR